MQHDDADTEDRAGGKHLQQPNVFVLVVAVRHGTCSADSITSEQGLSTCEPPHHAIPLHPRYFALALEVFQMSQNLENGETVVKRNK